METNPDYSKFHLSELQNELAKIDEESSPDRAKLIREYIAKGGYQYPAGSPSIDYAVFENKTYKSALIACVTILLLINLAALALTLNFLALLPVSIQAVMLYLIYSNNKGVRTAVKLWSVLLIIAGSFGLLSQIYAPSVNIIELVFRLVLLGIGGYFLVFSNNSIRLVENDSNQ